MPNIIEFDGRAWRFFPSRFGLRLERYPSGAEVYRDTSAEYDAAATPPPVAPQIGAVTFSNGVVAVAGVTLPGLFSAIISFSSAPIGGLAIANLAMSGNALAHAQTDLQRGDNTVQINMTGLETEPVLWLHTTVLASGLYATDQPVKIR